MPQQKLLTKAIEKTLPPLYSGEETPLAEKIIRVKFFTPWTNWTWYATEYDPKEQLFFGVVVGHETEWGYFSLLELQSARGRWGLKIERDAHFKPQTVAEAAKRDPGLKGSF